MRCANLNKMLQFDIAVFLRWIATLGRRSLEPNERPFAAGQLSVSCASSSSRSVSTVNFA